MGKVITEKDLESKVDPPPEKCPKCGGELVEGAIGSDFGYAMDGFHAPLVKKYPEEPHDSMCLAPVYRVLALACKKCGHTELYTNFGKLVRT